MNIGWLVMYTHAFRLDVLSEECQLFMLPVGKASAYWSMKCTRRLLCIDIFWICTKSRFKRRIASGNQWHFWILTHRITAYLSNFFCQSEYDSLISQSTLIETDSRIDWFTIFLSISPVSVFNFEILIFKSWNYNFYDRVTMAKHLLVCNYKKSKWSFNLLTCIYLMRLPVLKLISLYHHEIEQSYTLCRSINFYVILWIWTASFGTITALTCYVDVGRSVQCINDSVEFSNLFHLNFYDGF